MTRRLLSIAALVVAGSFLISCGKANEPEQPPVKKPAPAAQRPSAPAQVDMSAGLSGSIDNVRLRNPFQSHIMIMKSSPASAQKVKGPLECCELSMFKVLAAVVGVSDAEGFVLLQAPDGKRYVVRRGDVLGARDGRVIKIYSKGLIVREVTRDDDGKVKSTEDIDLKILEKKM